jgi:dipeptidyl aminopeptidase/acylaminoacyl peptidase
MRWTRRVLPLLVAAAPLYAQQPGPKDMPQEMVWVDRTGEVLGRVGAVQSAIFFPEISPDGRFITVSARDGEENDRDVWIHDIASGTKRRVMEVRGNDNFPFWSPDGAEIAFTSSRTGNYELYRRNLGPGGEDVLILEGERPEYPRDWSSDGTYLAFARAYDDRRSLLLLRMDRGKHDVREFLPAEPGVWNDGGRFSPNGKYYAFSSNAGGGWEVYVCEVENPTRRWRVSRPLGPGWAGGGWQPRWRGDGKELFYLLDSDTVASVEVDTSGELTHGEAKKLFTARNMRGNFPDESPWLHRYDATDDGERFVFVRKVDDGSR